MKKLTTHIVGMVALGMTVTIGTFAREFPEDGTEIVAQPMEFMSPDGKWDFSSLEPSGRQVRLKFNRHGDTLEVTLPGRRISYLIKGDTLLRTGIETHFALLRDTLPLLETILDRLHPECTDSLPTACRGLAFSHDHILSEGEGILLPDRWGDLILPGGDTLRCVSMSHNVHRRRLIESSIRPDTLPDMAIYRINHCYTWWSPDYMVPLAQSHIMTDSIPGGVTTEIERASWMCPPSQQPLPKAHTTVLNRVKTRGKSSDTAVGHGGTARTLTDTDMTLTVSGGEMTVTCGMPPAGDGMTWIEMIFTDVQGRVFGSLPRQEAHGGESIVWRMDVGGLPQGEYVLWVNTDEECLTRKIQLR